MSEFESSRMNGVAVIAKTYTYTHTYCRTYVMPKKIEVFDSTLKKVG